MDKNKKNGSLLGYFQNLFPAIFQNFLRDTRFYSPEATFFSFTLSCTVSSRKVTKQNRLNSCDTVPLSESFNSYGIRFISGEMMYLNMSRAWDKENFKFLIGIEPMTFCNH